MRRFIIAFIAFTILTAGCAGNQTKSIEQYASDALEAYALQVGYPYRNSTYVVIHQGNSDAMVQITAEFRPTFHYGSEWLDMQAMVEMTHINGEWKWEQPSVNFQPLLAGYQLPSDARFYSKYLGGDENAKALSEIAILSGDGEVATIEKIKRSILDINTFRYGHDQWDPIRNEYDINDKHLIYTKTGMVINVDGVSCKKEDGSSEWTCKREIYPRPASEVTYLFSVLDGTQPFPNTDEKRFEVTERRVDLSAVRNTPCYRFSLAANGYDQGTGVLLSTIRYAICIDTIGLHPIYISCHFRFLDREPVEDNLFEFFLSDFNSPMDIILPEEGQDFASP